jgi:23S rRNA pseudouridine2605 synthase
MTDDRLPEAGRPEMTGPADDAFEAEEATESAAMHADEAIDAPEAEIEADKAGPPAKLERLQKILAQAGIASRRHAEELITQGRVQVNGTVVTELGSKADATRDHIRVDGKLLQGAERVRYFVLNKPKGFVTTVSDPEGRPTVMQFFEKMRERLYPVGRLDYLSEGLLLVTNDGELANKLTRAASGVEKTYLVKVSGNPSEDDLDRLREGVAIDRERPGSGQVHTAPARIRQVRQGDNPWYEVVLIEGRNRELRKMFEEIGHFVEKIRRVGYGPLVLDLEPGKMRELDREEVEDLRKAAEGKLRPKKAKDARHNKAIDTRLPDARPKRGRPERGGRGFERAPGGSGEYRPKRRFGGERPERPARQAGERSWEGERREGAGQKRFGAGRPYPGRPYKDQDENRGQDRRAGQGGERQAFSGPQRADAGRSFGAKPAWKRSSERPPMNRPSAPGRDASDRGGFERPRPPRLRIDEVSSDRTGTERGAQEFRPKGRPGGDRRGGRRGDFEAGRSERPRFDRPRFDRPDAERSGGYRREGGESSTFGRGAGGRSPGRPAGKTGGWKPRAEFEGRTQSGERPKRGTGPGAGSRTGGFSRSGGYGSRPSGGAGRSGGPRAPGGARPGGSQGGRAKYGSSGQSRKRDGGARRKDRG